SSLVPPRVSADRCDFAGGQAAVAVNGAAVVKTPQCSFSPHAALFHLQDRCKMSETSLHLDNCTLFLTSGSAFRLDGAAAGSLSANYCLFVGPGRDPAAVRETHLIWQTEATAPNLRYFGQGNRFYDVTTYWVRPSAEKGIVNNWSSFLELVKQ